MPIEISIKYAKLPHGLVYFYQQWIPEKPKALVVFLHGLGDHSGRYDLLVRRMASEGIACCTYDQRGHGRTQGKRGHVDSFSDWVEDLGSFVNFSLEKVPENTPLFIVGHSLGAIIGIDYLLTHARPIAGMVSISGAFAPVLRIPKWKSRMGAKLKNIMPGIAIENGIVREDLTRDFDQFEAIGSDRYFHSKLTLGAGREIASTLSLIGGVPHRIHLPMLFATGSADRVCNPEGSRWFADRLSSTDKTLKIYEGMYHDMLHDVGREEVLDDITEWILSRAADATTAGNMYLHKRGEAIWEHVSQPG